MRIHKVLTLLLLTCSFATGGFAQDDAEFDESYRAFGVAMIQGVSGVIDIHITRWTTDEEREALVKALYDDGQEKMVDLLRKQKETGWVRTQSGAGMRGFPSTRLRYAREFAQPDGKRLLILITDRTITIREQRAATRSTDYEVSALVMELQKGEDGKEEGQGTLYLGTKLEFNKETNKLEVESLGAQPIRLPNIKREE